MKLLMGIDLGSTNIKVVVFDETGCEVAKAFMPNIAENMDKENREWLFWDPERVWQNTKSGIAQCAAAVKDIGDIIGISVTGMGMDGLPIDENGEYLYPFISWKCKRTESVCNRWSKRIGKKKIFDITGKQPMAIDTIYRILWIRENKPEIYDKIYKWLLIEDYINFKLCGSIATDYSMASCTSMFDQKQQTWSAKILKIAGIDKSILPEIKQSGTLLGTILPDVAVQLGINPDTRIILGGHDYSCAAVAVGAIDNGKVFNIVGTWEMFFSSTDKLEINNKLYKSGFKCERHAAKGKFAIFADVVSSLMVEWFKDNFMNLPDISEEYIWPQINLLAQNAGISAGGVFFLPHILGKGCPAIDDKSLGAFVGLSVNSDKGSMIRAIIEALNYQMKEILDSYEKMTGKKIQSIISVGGATKNDFWMQNKADIIEKVIEVPGITEATALGAALFAGIGTGVFKDENEAYKRTYKPGKTYTPGKDSEIYKRCYKRYYKRLYMMLKKFNREIFDEYKCINM